MTFLLHWTTLKNSKLRWFNGMNLGWRCKMQLGLTSTKNHFLSHSPSWIFPHQPAAKFREDNNQQIILYWPLSRRLFEMMLGQTISVKRQCPLVVERICCCQWNWPSSIVIGIYPYNDSCIHQQTCTLTWFYMLVWTGAIASTQYNIIEHTIDKLHNPLQDVHPDRVRRYTTFNTDAGERRLSIIIVCISDGQQQQWQNWVVNWLAGRPADHSREIIPDAIT